MTAHCAIAGPFIGLFATVRTARSYGREPAENPRQGHVVGPSAPASGWAGRLKQWSSISTCVKRTAFRTNCQRPSIG